MELKGGRHGHDAGLDSFAALNVMEHLSQLASLGHVVCASVHQPRTAIWDMFHKVTVPARLCSCFVPEPRFLGPLHNTIQGLVPFPKAQCLW